MKSRNWTFAFLIGALIFWIGNAVCADDWLGPQWTAEVKKRKPWLDAVVKQAFPNKPLHGTYRNSAFSPEEVLFYRRVLQVSIGDPTVGQAFVIRLPEHNVEGKTYYVVPESNCRQARCAADFKGSNITLCYFDTTGHSEPWGKTEGCAMKLQFGKMKNGLLPGYILLRIADRFGTNIEGYFYAQPKADGFYQD